MSQKEKWKWVYKVVRSLLFTTIAVVASLYVTLYILLSIPAVQDKIRTVAEDELSKLFTSTLTIDNVSIYPFNEVVIEGVALKEPNSDTDCANIERLGAGISIWRLIAKKEIVITYVELLGLDARLRQDKKDGDLNIRFLIDAFKPKEKNKPPTLFDLEIRNIVIRNSKASFSRPWLKSGKESFPNFSLFSVSDLNADVSIPRLSNDVLQFDVRRIKLHVDRMLDIKDLGGFITLDHGNLSFKNIKLETEGSKIAVNDLTLPLKYPGGLKKWFRKEKLDLVISAPQLSPTEFGFLWSPLSQLNTKLELELKASGNMHSVNLEKLSLSEIDAEGHDDSFFSLNVAGVSDFADNDGMLSISSIELKRLDIKSSPLFNSKLVKMLQRGAAGSSSVNDGQNRVSRIIGVLGNLNVSAKGNYSFDHLSGNTEGSAELSIHSGVGDIETKGEWLHAANSDKVQLDVNSESIDLGKLLAVDALGHTIINLRGDAIFSSELYAGKVKLDAEQILDYIKSANIQLDLPEAVIKNYRIEGFNLDFSKQGAEIDGSLVCKDENLDLDIDLQAMLAGANTELSLIGEIEKIRPSVFRGMVGVLTDGTSLDGGKDFEVSGNLDMHVKGNNLDNIQGEIGLNDVFFNDLSTGKNLTLNNLEIIAAIDEDEEQRRSYSIISDWIEGGIEGRFSPSRIPFTIQGMLSETYPTLILPPKNWTKSSDDDYFTFDFTINRNAELFEFLNLPVKLLYEAEIKGEYNGVEDFLTTTVSAPYIQQGKDKLIQKTRLNASLYSGSGNVNFNVVYPTKKGDLEVLGEIASVKGQFGLSLDFNPAKNTSFYGRLDMDASIENALPPMIGKEVTLHILPSTLYLNHAAWNVADAVLRYYQTSSGPMAEINGFSVSHERQFVDISGMASASQDDEITAILNDVDLDYIFDTLNINYVKFGGSASGRAVGAGLFSKDIKAETKGLIVKDLSYNGAVLGDGQVHGDFDIKRKRIGIKADIAEDKRKVAAVDGGIWLGRDSLSFDIDADKVRIGFLAPFMQAFASKVEGRASGNALLYGTFADVDMKGRLFADTISLGVAYTNVTYCGSDSVIINPGKIIIPSFTLRDVYGNSATLQGILTHRYFHDPEFEFNVMDARNLLLYDTNPNMNPVWYGRIFGTGGGRILGKGNYVGISADMTTEANSNFTFVLSDNLEAAEYNFLQFTDKRKAAEEAEKPVEISETDAIVEAFRKSVQNQLGPESVFGMDLRATLTPGVQLTLIMDPKADDKITARGSGAMNMEYRSDTDELKMFGKYVLDEGVYNFSLQDVILKDFIIKQGSSISFNGDPMSGLLDIRAAYRVNTNLADLDQSFAMDRDLNRTQVPVDAMLIVTGDMNHPDINFDIELPTLNDEVAQKVRSVISSEEMMNLQMIYLLALNRFYTPEYMGGSSGGEWASVASSTISSQLTNILGRLSDKFSVAPSFRSDKGDFSDLEVDVALSSRLLNNRLLINGNIGYRDPSTSNTTFIGDFDVEYLLNRAGNWRLKAYNHFNDQNYYLKSALTTQGVGIMWQRDFDHIFGLGRKNKVIKPESEKDTINP